MAGRQGQGGLAFPRQQEWLWEDPWLLQATAMGPEPSLAFNLS